MFCSCGDGHVDDRGDDIGPTSRRYGKFTTQSTYFAKELNADENFLSFYKTSESSFR
jgi:hypothetical protein